jgi:hypothetical protein
MRMLILSTVLLVCTQEIFAADFQVQSANAAPVHHPKKMMYSKGKGVFGLFTGLILGPVGYAATCIFSHNRMSRKKALLGMEIWLGVAFSVVIILLIGRGGDFHGSGGGGGSRSAGGSKGSSGSGPNFNISGFGTSEEAAPKKRKQPATPSIYSQKILNFFRKNKHSIIPVHQAVALQGMISTQSI